MASNLEDTEALAMAACLVLKSNPPAVLAEAGSIQVLTTLLGNLARNPGEEKFRRVRLGNAKISKALSCPGAEDLLKAAGFEKREDLLEVPTGRSQADVAAAARIALEALGPTGPFALSAQLRADAPVRCVCGLQGGGLASGAMDNVIRVYQAQQWEAPRLLFGHERRAGVDGVLALSPEADGSGLASAGRDGKIILWRDFAEVGVLKGHGEGIDGTNVHVVSCLGRSADGALLSGGWDKTARVWRAGAQVALLAGHSIAVNAVVGLPNGDLATGSGDQTIGIWRGGSRVHSLQTSAAVRALCACGEELLASAGNDGVVRLWDASRGTQLAERKVAESYLLSLARCTSTGELAVGADDGTVVVLDVESGGGRASLTVVETLQHCGEAYGLAFLENGDLAVACGDESCVVWSRSAARAASQTLQEDYGSRVKALLTARTATGGATPAAGSGTWDLSFPVEMGGRKMQLQWNRGEQPQVVAQRFLQANGLDSAHAGDVVAFVMHAEQQAVTGAGAPRPPAAAGFDFNFPVEVADGRRLMISWNRGDNPQAVALNFARQHGGIGADELPDIVAFVQQASGGAPAPAPAAPVFVQQTSQPSPALQQQAVQRVTEMGFDAATARAALQAAGWDVEAAVQRLLG